MTYHVDDMAEEEGFEPPRRVTDLLVFETSPFSHLGIPPYFGDAIEIKKSDVSIYNPFYFI